MGQRYRLDIKPLLTESQTGVNGVPLTVEVAGAGASRWGSESCPNRMLSRPARRRLPERPLPDVSALGVLSAHTGAGRPSPPLKDRDPGRVTLDGDTLPMVFVNNPGGQAGAASPRCKSLPGRSQYQHTPASSASPPLSLFPAFVLSFSSVNQTSVLLWITGIWRPHDELQANC